MQNNRRAGKPAGKKPDKTGLLGLFTKGKDIPTTAQQTLPYREMYRDGVCRVEDRYYTKTIEYEDINYSGLCKYDGAVSRVRCRVRIIHGKV